MQQTAGKEANGSETAVLARSEPVQTTAVKIMQQESSMEDIKVPADRPIDQEFVPINSRASVIDVNSEYDESGRTFSTFRQGKYLFPNDPTEQDRLDLQHKCFMLLFRGKLALAPMTKTPKYVLDAACGTGIWAVDYAEENPSSIVIGCDLSAIQTETPRANCSWVQDDCEAEWVYPDVPAFDYVHFRMVFSCFEDTRTVIQHAFKNLAPGGWVEFQDSALEFTSVDGSHKGTPMERYGELVAQGAAAMGRKIQSSKNYKDYLVEAGFVDVVEKLIMWPCNTWPDDARQKLIGRYNTQNVTDGIRGVGWKLLRAAGLEPSEIEDLILKFQQQLTDPKYHLYLPCYVVYGRKPLEGEPPSSATPECVRVGFPPGFQD